MRITTKTGDDGTTGLFHGGRVPKDSELPRAYGAVDEAQAALGVVRAETDPESDLHDLVSRVCRDLYVVMAELATLPENHHKLDDGVTRVSPAMVSAIETLMDDLAGQFEPPTDFVIPGENRVTAYLDLARTLVRRAERESLAAAAPDGHVVVYLNRLSDLVWTMARWQEGVSIITRTAEGTADLA